MITHETNQRARWLHLALACIVTGFRLSLLSTWWRIQYSQRARGGRRLLLRRDLVSGTSVVSPECSSGLYRPDEELRARCKLALVRRAVPLLSLRHSVSSVSISPGERSM